jgi:5S rRNA maturation endonuclease (ribonuclease M5)
MGFYAISASSETTFIPDDILAHLKKKWKHIVILYDRDKTGMLKARGYSKMYKLHPVFVNKRYHAKDVSDAVKANGFQIIKDWLIKTLDEYD